jgi:hypothetical protein
MLVTSFMFFYLRKDVGFPCLFRGPLSLSPTMRGTLATSTFTLPYKLMFGGTNLLKRQGKGTVHYSGGPDTSTGIQRQVYRQVHP